VRLATRLCRLISVVDVYFDDDDDERC
jgi:hypothetical protein